MRSGQKLGILTGLLLLFVGVAQAQERRAAKILFGPGVKPSLELYQNLDGALYQLGIDDMPWTWAIVSESKWGELSRQFGAAGYILSETAFTIRERGVTYLREGAVSGAIRRVSLRHTVAHEWGHVTLKLGSAKTEDEKAVDNFASDLERKGRRGAGCS